MGGELPENRSRWASARGIPWSPAAGAGAESGAGPRSGDSASDRALLRLLRLTALSSTDSCRDRLYTLLVSTLQTMGAAMNVFICITMGSAHLAAGGSLVYAASVSAFFGLIFVMLWVALAWCLLRGCRSHGALMVTVASLLERVDLLQGSVRSARRLRRVSRLLLATAVLLLITTGAIPAYSMLSSTECSTVSRQCLQWLGYVALAWLFLFSVYMVPIKFVLTAFHITSGFWAINLELRAALRGRRCTDYLTIHQLRELHDALSRAFSCLGSISAGEITTLLLSGVTQLVCLAMMLVTGWQTGTLWYNGPYTALYTCGTVITVLLPCEISQRTLDAVRETRDLLLRPEWRPSRRLHMLPDYQRWEPAEGPTEGHTEGHSEGHAEGPTEGSAEEQTGKGRQRLQHKLRQDLARDFPAEMHRGGLPEGPSKGLYEELSDGLYEELSKGMSAGLSKGPDESVQELRYELGLFRETVSRDLDTLGDLGMVRLQRSTVLSIATTILTYIIILLQFFVTELSTP